MVTASEATQSSSRGSLPDRFGPLGFAMTVVAWISPRAAP